MVSSEGSSSVFNHFDKLHKCNISHWIRIHLESGGIYLFWKAQMENLFEIHDVVDIVDLKTIASAKKNSDGSDNPLYRDEEIQLREHGGVCYKNSCSYWQFDCCVIISQIETRLISRVMVWVVSIVLSCLLSTHN